MYKVIMKTTEQHSLLVAEETRAEDRNSALSTEHIFKKNLPHEKPKHAGPVEDA